MMRNALLLLAAMATPSVLAAPAATTTPSSTSVALLKMPYATYAAAYDADSDLYTFNNVRYAAPPTGTLRWAAPAAPTKEAGINTGASQFYACMQDLDDSGNIPVEYQSEDCLTLDVVVPGVAIRGTKKNLPVAFWIHGGGYAFGSKLQYPGDTYPKASNNSLIYVKINYRVGAFGFLNGVTVQKSGVANAGLLDQRAALQWVQSYIGLVGGDKTQVTAFGESAGASSIIYHLTAKSGTQDPLFARAITQSIANKAVYDQVALQKQFVTFANIAGCPGSNPTLACLRGLSTSALQNANQNVTYQAGYGDYAFLPGIDNSYVKDIFQVELARGHFWKNTKLVIGHNLNEGWRFTDKSIVTDSAHDAYIKGKFPDAPASVLKQFSTLYPPASSATASRYFNETGRISNIIAEGILGVCAARQVRDAYAGNTYNYVWAEPPSYHAIDLAWTYFPGDNVVPKGYKSPETAFQSYLVSFILTGNPNTYRQVGTTPPTVQFNTAGTGSSVNALYMSSSNFAMQVDTSSPQDRCAFWASGVYTGRKY